jgi:quercetin dioxygenase-like cupin family protein
MSEPKEFSSIAITRDDAMKRIARFADLTPLAIQSDAYASTEALDIIYARKLLPVIGLADGASSPINEAAPISGAGGVAITFAFAPPGQGPDLHAHKATFETFTVLEGEFEFRWGDADDQAVRLTKFDTFSVPPGIYRAFRNVGETDGYLQVIISGGEHNMQDIHMPGNVADRLKGASPTLYDKVTRSGVTVGGAA